MPCCKKSRNTWQVIINSPLAVSSSWRHVHILRIKLCASPRKKTKYQAHAITSVACKNVARFRLHIFFKNFRGLKKTSLKNNDCCFCMEGSAHDHSCLTGEADSMETNAMHTHVGDADSKRAMVKAKSERLAASASCLMHSDHCYCGTTHCFKVWTGGIWHCH